MRLKDIRIGTRHRADVGDVRSLAASIAKLRRLHAIVVDFEGLVAGARRLAAVESLGWRDVPVRTVRTLTDAASALRAEARARQLGALKRGAARQRARATHA